MPVGNLCCDEEDIIRDVPHSAADDSQCHSWEDVGVVPLAREEGLSVGQGHLWEWTPACKYSPALIKERERGVKIQKRHLTFLLLAMICAQGTLVTKWTDLQPASGSPPEPSPADTSGGLGPQSHRQGHQAPSGCWHCPSAFNVLRKSLFLSINHLRRVRRDSSNKGLGAVWLLYPAAGGGEGEVESETRPPLSPHIRKRKWPLVLPGDV